MDGRQLAKYRTEFCGNPAGERGSRAPILPRSAARPVIFISAALALLVPYGYSAAQVLDRVEDSVGPALICNTPQQVTRFIELVNAGRDAVDALRLVNEEAKDPTACGNGWASFEVGKPVAEVSMLGELISIVEVTVNALSDGSAWRQVPPTTQYIIREIHGQSL